MFYELERKKISHMHYSLYVLLILLTLYTDSPLQRSMGYMGITLLPPIILPIYLYMFLNKTLISDVFSRKYFKLLLYTLFISIVALLVFTITGVSLVQKGEALEVKAIKGFVMLFSYYAYVKVVISLIKNYSLEQVLKPFFWGFIILTILLLLEVLQIPNAFPGIHYALLPYYRVRLLTPEASGTAIMLEIFFFVSFYYVYVVRHSKLLTVFLIVCMLLHVLFSGSRTFLIAVIISMIIMYWNNVRSGMKSKGGIMLMILLTSGIWGFVQVVLPSLIATFMNDFENYTSTVTRSYSIFCGVLIGLEYPFGTGFSSYLYLFPEKMKSMLWIVNSIGKDLDTSEIISYAYSRSDVAVTAKSFIGQTSMYWGVLGSIYFVKIFYNAFVDSLKKSNLKFGVLFKCVCVVLLIQLTLSSELEYSMLALVSVMIFIGNNIRCVDKYK